MSKLQVTELFLTTWGVDCETTRNSYDVGSYFGMPDLDRDVGCTDVMCFWGQVSGMATTGHRWPLSLSDWTCAIRTRCPQGLKDLLQKHLMKINFTCFRFFLLVCLLENLKLQVWPTFSSIRQHWSRAKISFPTGSSTQRTRAPGLCL